MAQVKQVDTSVQPTYLGDTYPLTANEGDTFVNEATFPKSLYVWWQGAWKFFGYLREVTDPGQACYIPTVANNSYIDRKLSFVTEACTVVSIVLPRTYGASAAADTLVYGYILGGQPGINAISNIARMQFETQTASSVTSTLTEIRGYDTAAHDADYAWIPGGGKILPLSYPSDTTSKIDKFAFSSESCNSITSTLRRPMCALAATQSASDGFFAGGTYGAAPGSQVTTSNIDRIQFSTDATFYLASTTSTGLGDGMCGLSAQVNGYNAGGTLGGGWATAVIDRFSFVSYTVAALASSLSIARGLTSGGMNAMNGYVFGGYNGTAIPNSYSTIDRLVFSSEITGVMASTLGVVSSNIPQGMNDLRNLG